VSAPVKVKVKVPAWARDWELARAQGWGSELVWEQELVPVRALAPGNRRKDAHCRFRPRHHHRHMR